MTLTNQPTLLFINVSELKQHPDLLHQMLNGSQLGAIIRGAFDPAALKQLQQSIGTSETIKRTAIEYYSGWQYGRTLVISKPDLQEYFTEAEKLRQAVHSTGLNFEQQLQHILAQISGNQEVSSPIGPQQQHYGMSTIRIVQPGGEINLHCENETSHFAPVSHLASVLDLSSQLSFYTPLSLPEKGGQLTIYHSRHGDSSGQPLLSMDRTSQKTLQYVEQFGTTVAEPNVGDLLIFDAGRYYHRVSKIEGNLPRWTMGGFIASSKNKTSLHYWS